jgi:CelD/BcsL family acetyltransferase involved in cellulose biosynthesis
MPVRNMSSEEGQPQVRVVRDLEELSRYASQWNDLASKAPQCMPTSSYAWVSAYFEHRVGDEERWVVLLAVDEGTLVGVLPLIASPHLVVGMTCPILHTPYDSQIAACDVVLAAGREQEVFELLFKAATELFPRRVSIEIREIPSTSATLHVADVVEASLIKEFARPGSFLPIEGSFEDYRASIRPELRRNLKKAHNRFNKLDRVEFEILAGESAIEAELDRFASVEAASWKGAEGGAIVRSQSLVDFYTTLTRRLSEAGWLHWGFLSVGDKDIAASLTVKLQRNVALQCSLRACGPTGALEFGGRRNRRLLRCGLARQVASVETRLLQSRLVSSPPDFARLGLLAEPSADLPSTLTAAGQMGWESSAAMGRSIEDSEEGSRQDTVTEHA